MYSQLWNGLAVIATLGSCVLADHRLHRHVRGNSSVEWDHLMMRDDDTTEFDPTDLSYIQSMAAIGDSYSAGIGAGERLGAITQALQPESVIADVINNQIPSINGNQQVIMLSAGGNDVELSNILNQCIFQWAVLNSNQVAVTKAAALADPDYTWAGSYDWDSLGLGCDGQLARTRNLIAGDAFSKSLDSVIEAAKAKLGSKGMIYYTGYAKFWAEDLSSACDSVSWATWIYNSQKLTTDHRRTMNELVDSVNAQISAAVDGAGSQVKFVNYDSYVGYFNGRFCETGVDESTAESNTSSILGDPLGRNPYKRSQDNPLNGTFEGSVNQLAQITLLMDPDATLSDQAFVSDAATVDATTAILGESKISLSAESSDLEVPNILPDGYWRVFHPQMLLHELIAELVIYEMVNFNEQDNGYPAIPEQFTFDSCPYYPPTNGSNGTTDGQQIALASYINPLSDPAAWNRIIDYPGDKVTVLVANILNVPDTTVDVDWQKVINRAYSAGKRVLGYVRTGYLGVSQDHFQTRLGSSDLADWWYKLYPGVIGGIFFDEGWNDCGTDNQYSELYRFITDTKKRKHPGAFTVLNPGATMPQCFEHSADTLMTFKNSYDTYMNHYVANPDWTPSDSRKLWHIIYNVPADKAGDVAALARERGAGLIHITDDNLPNPYDTLPDDTYMQTIMSALDGGGPAIADPSAYSDPGDSASQPSSLSVTFSDYSSVTLSWDANSKTPYAYAVCRDGTEVVRLPGTMTKVIVGNIDSGSSMTFTVRARGTDGTETSDSNSVSATTLSLPDNQAVTNVKSLSTATSTTVQADILVPFAFVRVFLTDPDTRCSMPSWPINYNTGNFICTHYMVEGSALYQYTGANLTDGQTNYPWTWTSINTAPVSRNGYTYTWTLPIGSSTTDPNYFVVEAQGYNPITNVFHPCPSTGASCTGKAPYDCKGETLCSTLNVKCNCWANWEQYGCSVQVRGKDQNMNNCQITGDEMWEAYQDIRNIGGCKKCGTKHFGNGCLVSVDYYYGCDNRDNGVNSLDT
ncbi:fibronectin type III domain protein [Aspergillus sclerotioniger CBS 115572]|uniref:Fibronectin type III domain protein n=1 Tax=Aspergillus sclerotioniger CBS 115572 TaxID=1450535 RepID=A0A317XGW2_9EURO|nr:fibronectin type III domain protein [Aspergillus sclerotioniger CBS 115572]PWY96628.1 fibronectin type III domain protein [Aspergillus sclerotioniger CBS 115572]